MFISVIKRELLRYYRQITQCMVPLLFFIIVCVLFPLAVSDDANTLQKMGPGVIWIGALLANLLSLSQLFQRDYDEGVLDQWLLHSQPLSVMLSAKMLTYWLMFTCPIILLTPWLCLLFHLSVSSIGVLMLTLLLGSPVISVQGAVMAAFCVGVDRQGLLLSILLLPLYIPVLVIGSTMTRAASQGVPVLSPFLILAAMCVFAITIAPSVTAFALRSRIEYE